MRRLVVVAAPLAIVLSALLSGCTHAGPITRVEPQSVIDLSGHWNDADANLVAAQMTDDCIRNGWAERFTRTHGGTLPVIRLFPIRNRTDEHLSDLFFTKQVEAALLRTGRVRVVESFEESADNRVERADQAWFASPATQKPGHMETGSDYVLNGWVIAQHDVTEGVAVKAYLATMELSDTTSNEKVWIGEQRIKKVIAYAQ